MDEELGSGALRSCVIAGSVSQGVPALERSVKDSTQLGWGLLPHRDWAPTFNPFRRLFVNPMVHTHTHTHLAFGFLSIHVLLALVVLTRGDETVSEDF